MRVESVTCDVCGAIKQKTNHWFVIATNRNGKALVEVYAPGDATSTKDDFDLCGESCVLKKVSELIALGGRR